MKFILSIIVALTLASTSAFSEEPGGCPHACKPNQYEMTHATGTLYCVGCALKEQFGSKADCEKGGHQLAIKVTKCEDYCGEEKAGLIGTTLFFLPTEATLKIDPVKNYGKTVTLSGRYYFTAGVIEPEEVKIVTDDAEKKG